MLLSREIRFALVDQYKEKITNSWSGWPATNMLAPHLALRCTIEGTPNETGYICNIKDLDHLLRTAVTQQIADGLKALTTAQLLRSIYDRCRQQWKHAAPIHDLTLIVTPYLRLTIKPDNDSMIELTQQFEFSAAHRLHCDHLSDKENRELFGKCNNPEGHGHNYVVEVSICGDPGIHGQVFDLHEFGQIVKENVVDILDHKHLNKDVDYFRDINPSVENISKAIFDWLVGKFGDAKLNRVRVYETPKTWAQYDAIAG